MHRDGTVAWFESINRTDDIIDDRADGFAAVPSVGTFGTGGYACNCDHCNDSGYGTREAAIADAIDCDLSGIEEAMTEALQQIPQGYFDDEAIGRGGDERGE